MITDDSLWSHKCPSRRCHRDVSDCTACLVGSICGEKRLGWTANALLNANQHNVNYINIAFNYSIPETSLQQRGWLIYWHNQFEQKDVRGRPLQAWEALPLVTWLDQNKVDPVPGLPYHWMEEKKMKVLVVDYDNFWVTKYAFKRYKDICQSYTKHQSKSIRNIVTVNVYYTPSFQICLVTVTNTKRLFIKGNINAVTS